MSVLPEDHHLAHVYRFGGALIGLFLLAFGGLGFANRLEFFSTAGHTIAGLSSNGALSLVSVVVGLVLLASAMTGGNLAARANTVFGVLFLLSGLIHLALLRTDLNFLAFRMPNVIFSFVVGTTLLTFGMYGRTSGSLDADRGIAGHDYTLDAAGLAPSRELVAQDH